MNGHSEEKKEKATKNATALRHMTRRLSILGDKATIDELNRVEEEMKALDKLADRQQREMRNLLRVQTREMQALKKEQQKELENFEESLKEDSEQTVRYKEQELTSNMGKLEELIHARCMRLIARWHLMLQIYKRENRDASSLKGPLPLTMLCLPEEFTPYVAAYQS
jgi:septal ring factor EnvC (AmiA/AmiB activator)